MDRFRSPVLGYNHNVRHRGWVFHVQTEDSGIQSPHLYTHLFHAGIIIVTKKMVYDPGADPGVIKSLMQAQHKSVLRELKHGKYDDKIDRYLGSAAPSSQAAEGTGPVAQSASPEAVSVEMEADAPLEDAVLVATESGGEGVPQVVADDATTHMEGLPTAMLRDLGTRETVRATIPRASRQVDAGATIPDPVPTHVVAGRSVPTTFDGSVPAAVDWAESEQVEVPLPPSGTTWEITEPAAADSRGAGAAARASTPTEVREPARAERPPARPAPPAQPQTEYSQVRRKTGPATPPRIPPAAYASPPPGARPADKPVTHPWITSPPEPPPVARGRDARPPALPTGAKPNATIFAAGAPAPATERKAGGPAPSRTATPPLGSRQAAPVPVVARPAVIIGAPPTPVGGPSPSAGSPAAAVRRGAAAPVKPPDSIFGQDRLSEKSLDEVILAYLSEDSKDE